MTREKQRTPQNPEAIARMIVRNIKAFDACCGPEFTGFKEKKICKECIERVRRYIVACKWLMYVRTPILTPDSDRAIVHELLNDDDEVGCVFRHLDSPGNTFTVHINRSDFDYILDD